GQPRPTCLDGTDYKQPDFRIVAADSIGDDGSLMAVCSTEFAGLVEFSPGFVPRPRISHVLFDFDGTLSLIRQGWPEVMVPMFVEMLPPLPGESGESRRQLCYDDIMRLNGKQTIYQMIQLTERIKERGGTPREPLWYKREYLRRLDQRIGHRLEGLRS